MYKITINRRIIKDYKECELNINKIKRLNNVINNKQKEDNKEKKLMLVR